MSYYIDSKQNKCIMDRRFCEGKIGQFVKIKKSYVDEARSDLRSNFGMVKSGFISILIVIFKIFIKFQ